MFWLKGQKCSLITQLDLFGAQVVRSFEQPGKRRLFFSRAAESFVALGVVEQLGKLRLFFFRTTESVVSLGVVEQPGGQRMFPFRVAATWPRPRQRVGGRVLLALHHGRGL